MVVCKWSAVAAVHCDGMGGGRAIEEKSAVVICGQLPRLVVIIAVGCIGCALNGLFGFVGRETVAPNRGVNNPQPIMDCCCDNSSGYYRTDTQNHPPNPVPNLMRLRTALRKKMLEVNGGIDD